MQRHLSSAVTQSIHNSRNSARWLSHVDGSFYDFSKTILRRAFRKWRSDMAMRIGRTVQFPGTAAASVTGSRNPTVEPCRRDVTRGTRSSPEVAQPRPPIPVSAALGTASRCTRNVRRAAVQEAAPPSTKPPRLVPTPFFSPQTHGRAHYTTRRLRGRTNFCQRFPNAIEHVSSSSQNLRASQCRTEFQLCYCNRE